MKFLKKISVMGWVAIAAVAGLGVWYFAFRKKDEKKPDEPKTEPKKGIAGPLQGQMIYR